MRKMFEIAAEKWGETNTIQYFVTGYTQITKAVFNSKKELMEMFQGIADDYFSAKAEEAGGKDHPRTVDEWIALWKKEDE